MTTTTADTTTLIEVSEEMENGEWRKEKHHSQFFIPNLLFFASGFAALVYEVSWNRQLGLLFGHTASATAVVLAAYFGGMAIGYAVGGRVASRVCPFRGYAVCEFAAGIWALAIPAVIPFVTQADVDAWLQTENASLRTLSRVLFSLLLLAPATISLGATLPMMSEMLARWQTEHTVHRDRLFSLIFHNSTYTFSFILISFLLGLSLGAVAAQRLLTRFPARSILSWTSCLAAVAVILSVVVFVLTTRLEYFETGQTFATYYLGGLLLVLAVTLPVAFLAGIYLNAATPFQLNICRPKVHLFRSLGRGNEQFCFQNQKRRSNEQ